MDLPELRRNPRYTLLDIFRGVACLMIVVHHAGFALLPGDAPTSIPFATLGHVYVRTLWYLNLGVPLFFVISGYCIGASIDATRRRGSSPLRFLGRRVWRIYPPYWAAVGWFLLVTIGMQRLGLEKYIGGHLMGALELIRPQGLNAAQWLGNLSLTETWRHIIGGGASKIFTRVAWSLCYEEQFYFLCFLTLLLFPRRLYAALGWATVAIVLFRVAAADVGMLHRLDGTFVDLWHQFAVGLAVYWRLNVPADRWKKRAIEALLLGTALIGFDPNLQNVPVAYSTGTTALFGLLLIALRPFDARICGRPWMRPFKALGRRSYSVYLFHLPITTVCNFWLYDHGVTGFWARALFTVPVVATVAVAGCFGFFWLVERHFLNPPIVGPSRRAVEARAPLAGEAAAPAAGE